MTTPSKTPITDAAEVNAGWIIAAHSNGNFVPIEVCRSLEEAAQGLRDALEIAKVTDLTGNPHLRKPIDVAIARFDALKEGK